MRTLVSAFAILTAVGAWGCTCAQLEPRPCPGLGGYGVVFLGTVTDIENPPDEDPKVGNLGVSRYRFRIEERFAGLGGVEVDVYSGRGGADCSYHFKRGEQYLVFPYQNKDGLFATICSDTRHVNDARALLTQLRAMRNGQPVASLFGTLRRSQQPYESVIDPDFEKPLARTVVRLYTVKRQFKTLTDENGVFAFYTLPAGEYRVGADLPPTSKLASRF